MVRRSLFVAFALFAGLSSVARAAHAHCQVPCGIYDDPARVEAMREDVKTISKAMAQIAALAPKRDPLSQNQLVRWVMTKEEHAERIMRTIADYFMAQLIEPASDRAYLDKLARHHAVLVGAMKCKQRVAASDAAALGKAIDAIAGYWKK